MTSVPFRGGAIDLSALKPAPPAPAGAVWWVEADDRTFESYLGLSMQHPIVVEFWSPRAPSAAQLSADLKDLANEAAGAWLLVRVDVDQAQGIAQALQVQGVPMVIGIVGGQLAPLFQGTADKAQVKAVIDQLVALSHQQGIAGRAQPVVPDAAATDGPDPRFEAADAALERGDYETAIAEFDKLLAANPADTEASAGRAQARLIQRVTTGDPDAVRSALAFDVYDVDANLAMADLELAAGNVDAAFARLVELIRQTTGEERERVRVRLLELFETIGPTDPAVLTARRALMSALF
ncbi:MAG: tetratricopeptide repeat protein [Propioniciclava sp.]|uniref:tetratricopeptide repeat protein n=1 Tax=Propioniciclava sp. TaxID=2038686 RepID=UPI0039E6F79C